LTATSDGATSKPAALVPVTIIGGYLGAGKTTLINALLAADHGRRLAVLVNDFGAVNIDVELIERHDGETISLTNGCICCSIADSLGESLDQVLALEPRPDQIVIEASGVADPAAIAGYGQGWWCWSMPRPSGVRHAISSSASLSPGNSHAVISFYSQRRT
jgi:hypothetical protein